MIELARIRPITGPRQRAKAEVERLLGGAGALEEVALHQPPAQALDVQDLLGRLQSFDDAIDIELAGKFDDGSNRCPAPAIAPDLFDEGAVDLDDIDREPMDPAQTGLA